MQRNLFNCFVAASLCAPAFAVGQSPATEPAVTLHASANLVVVDVVATDSHQNPVHNLTAADFTLVENGQAQTIKTFEEHTSAETAKLLPLPKLEPGTFTNYTPTPGTGSLNILLLDSLNTPTKDQPYVREQLQKYLKEAPSGTRIAIFGLTTQLRLLQGFSSDPETIRAALNGKKAGPKSSALLNDPMNGDGPGANDPMMDMAEDALGNSPGAAEQLASLQQFEAEQQSFQMQIRIRYSLDAFNQLGRYLSRLPGRKNLIWFSGSFPFSILPDGDLQNPFSIAASYEDEFRETTNLLARSQVAVYPIDARGLMNAPMMDAANTGHNYARNPAAFAKDQTKFFQQTAAEHGTMMEMADATGGKAFVNTNGLKEAVEKAVEAGSNYYTLAYTPSNHDWKGDYRKIQIKLARQGLNLAYRRGYFADDPNAPVHHGEPKISSNDHVSYNAMYAAMLRGGPDPTEIIFGVNVRPNSNEPEQAVAPGNRVNPKASGPYRRYTVNFTVSPRDIECAATPDGMHHCVVEFMSYAYDADGMLLNAQSNAIKADIMAPHYATLLRSGIQYRQEISVPVKGESFLRIGVHDVETDHVGAVELPVGAVSRLTPLSAPAAPSASGPATNPK